MPRKFPGNCANTTRKHKLKPNITRAAKRRFIIRLEKANMEIQCCLGECLGVVEKIVPLAQRPENTHLWHQIERELHGSVRAPASAR